MPFVQFPQVNGLSVGVSQFRLRVEMFRYSSVSDAGVVFSRWFQTGIRGRWFGTLVFTPTFEQQAQDKAERQAERFFFDQIYDDNDLDIPYTTIPMGLITSLPTPTPAASAFPVSGTPRYATVASSADLRGIRTITLDRAITGLTPRQYLSVASDIGAEYRLIRVLTVSTNGREITYTPPHQVADGGRIYPAQGLIVRAKNYDIQDQTEVAEDRTNLVVPTFDFVEVT